jgi:hypothetical protein
MPLGRVSFMKRIDRLRSALLGGLEETSLLDVHTHLDADHLAALYAVAGRRKMAALITALQQRYPGLKDRLPKSS